MKELTMENRNLLSLLVAASALICLACSETPTEPAALASRTPQPTAVPGRPASMFGDVYYHNAPDPHGTIGCQGRTAVTAPDGTFTLEGLVFGKTVVTIQYFPGDYAEAFQIELRPGANEVGFSCDQGCNR